MVTNPHKSLKAFRRAVKIRAEKIMARALKNDSKENENETNLRRKRNVVYTSGLKFEKKNSDKAQYFPYSYKTFLVYFYKFVNFCCS